MTNPIKEKLSRDEPVYGVIAPNCDAILAETVGLLGFDFYMIDGEHGPGGPTDALAIAMACELTHTVPLARIRSVDPKLILQYLDAGIAGLMMPGIEHEDDVRRLVDAVKYPPIGKRGLGPVRAARYMMGPLSQAEYVASANRDTLILPQLESMAAVRRLPKLLEVEGIDGFIIGPRDLAMDMGFTNGPNHPEVQAVIDEIFTAIGASSLHLGTVAGNAAAAQALIDRGARILLNSVAGLLKAGTRQFLPTQT